MGYMHRIGMVQQKTILALTAVVAAAFLVGGYGLVNNVNAADISKIQEAGSLALDNAAQLRKALGPIQACTASFEAYDTSLLDPCHDMIQKFNDLMHNYMTETAADRSTIDASGYSTSSYSGSSFGSGSSLY